MGQTFIDEISPYAIDYGTKGGVLPALIIAQGILESNSGQSELAINAKNLFGIKKGVGWTGPVYVKSSKEWSALMGYYDSISEFRAYDTFEGCIRDLVEFYQKPRYAAVIGERDFLAAATAAHNAGYATDPNYTQKLYNIYIQYNLEGFKMADIIISVDAGHAGFGVTPGKRGPDGKFEWVWNNASVLAFIAHMTTTYNGVRVVRVDDPTGKTDVPLQTRVSRSNAAGAHLHISFHMNALSTTWKDAGLGTETFIAQGNSATSVSARAQDVIHPALVKAMGLKDRGQKQAPFYILMYTNAPAILLEGGFMDSRTDRKRMDNPTVINSAAIAVADVTGKFFGLKEKATAPKPSPAAQKWFRVRKSWADIAGQVGAFLDAEEAKIMAEAKKVQGYKVFDNDGKLYFDPNAKKLFRVRKTWADIGSQLGAFTDIELAKDLADHNAAAGYEVYDEDGKVVHQPLLVPKPEVKPIEIPVVIPAASETDKEKEAKAEAEAERRKQYHFEVTESVRLGFTDGSNPYDPVTREQAGVMAYRSYKAAKEGKE